MNAISLHAPQIIVLAMWILGLLLHAVKHGEQKPAEKYNVVAFAISRGLIWLPLLWWGGFFSQVSA